MRKWLLCLMLMLCVLSAAAAEGNMLDLRGSTYTGLDALTGRIEAAGDVDTVELTGVDMPLEDRKALLAKYPDIHFQWTLSVFGKDIASDATVMDMQGCHVGSTKLLCSYIDCLPNLEQVLLYNNFISIEDKDYLFYTYPDIFFGYTVNLQQTYAIRTEIDSFSTLKNGAPPYVYSNQLWWVKMCPNLKALDLGHNAITNLDWLYDAPKLKVLILACNSITDITPLSVQTELEYLELFVNQIKDISPLANLKNLKDLNLCFNQITDVTALYDLPNLERLWLTMNKEIPQEQIDKLHELYPDAEIIVRSDGSTGDIWRDDGGKLPGWRTHDRYFVIYHIFNEGEYVPWDAEVRHFDTNYAQTKFAED